MNQKTTKIAALALMVVVLLSALTGCSTSKVDTVAPSAGIVANRDLEGMDCNLDADAINDIAALLTATYSASEFDSWELLVAAYRGYDLLNGEPAVDTTIGPAPAKETDLEAVCAIIKEANTLVEVKDDRVAESVYGQLNANDTLMIIKAMQTEIDLDEKGNAIDTLLGWIGTFLNWLNNLTGSYLFALFIFAILVELLMLPLGIRQQKNSIRQANLRPKEMAIRKRYAGRDDQVTRQKINEEIQQLYQRENFNPASGCLPLLLQIPIIMALYNIVIDPLHYVLGQASSMTTALNLYFTTAREAGGLGQVAAQAGRGTIEILSKLQGQMDGLKDFLFFGNGDEIYETMASLTLPNFNLGGVNLGMIPSWESFDWLLLVPVLTFIVYFSTMKLTKKFTYQPTNTAVDDRQAACSNWMMDITMPLMSTWFCFMVPALVGVYWIFKSLISTLRQFVVCKIMPYPKFTEEDYRAAEREYAGKAPKNAPAAHNYSYPRGTQTVGGKPKSLFHMDDDDYVAKIEEEARREEEEKAAKADSAANKGVAPAELKDDRKDTEKKNKK